MRISDWSSDVCSSDLPLKKPISAAASTISGKGTSSTKIATNASAAKPRMTLFFKAREPTRTTACSTTASTAAFNPKNNPSTSGRSEEHTSELQSLMRTSYAVFCLKKKNKKKQTDPTNTI